MIVGVLLTALVVGVARMNEQTPNLLPGWLLPGTFILMGLYWVSTIARFIERRREHRSQRGGQTN